jgi:serine-type D-Ala-D-Ala carboxypeptidase/endopeptidase
MLKFLSANMGLIKTKLDKAMQESLLIRLDTGHTLPNNLKAAANDNTTSGFYAGLGWFITTDLETKLFGIMALLLMVIMPLWLLIQLLIEEL